jgi:hypothetical protein
MGNRSLTEVVLEDLYSTDSCTLTKWARGYNMDAELEAQARQVLLAARSVGAYNVLC